MTNTGSFFDSDGGFYAIDHARQTASYAYPTSPHADDARHCPGRVLAEMLAEQRRCEHMINSRTGEPFGREAYRRAVAVAQAMN